METLADRVDALEVAVDECLIHDDHRRRICPSVVRGLEQPASEELLSCDGEKARGYTTVLDYGHSRRIDLRLAPVANVRVVPPVHVRHEVDRRGALDTGQGANRRKRRLEKSTCRRLICITSWRRRHAHCEHVSRLEARV